VKPLKCYGKWMALFLAALLPRLWQLDRFITADEVLFLDHARQFLEGLTRGDFSLTLGIGYPGVTLAWANALGLWVMSGLARLGWLSGLPAGLTFDQFLTAAEAQPLPYYVMGRVVSALLVTFLLLVLYAVARRLLDLEDARPNDVAWLGVLLLALDPYTLGYSRLAHIAVPLALLMLLTAMAWSLWLKGGPTYWLLLSGIFGGLALLTKTTALLLVPILPALAGLTWLTERHLPARRGGKAVWPWLGRTWLGWLAVLGIGALVFCALWPAMWQDPGKALGLTFDKLWVDKEVGQGNLGMYWMGHFVEDPGPAFYLVAALLKLSPLMLIGLVVNLVSLRRARDRSAEWGLWAYAFLYLLAMTLATKKSVRYMLPSFVAFGFLAAYGLSRAGHWLTRATLPRLQRSGYGLTKYIGSKPLQIGLGVLLLGFALAYAPYYLSYYNPLLLGWLWAPRAILVGWGEGLGDAAHYLNQQPGAEQATVAAWYDWTFAPFFRGRTLPFSTQNALLADYSVVYVNQVQRDIPDPNLISYFQRRRPQYVVRLNGIDYAWVYAAVSTPGPPPSSATPVGVAMGDAVVLEGYEVRPAKDDQAVIVTLYWRAVRSDLPDYFVYVRAVDAAAEIRARADSPPVMGFWPTSRWEVGKLVADEQVLLRPAETPPGAYRLEVGMYDPESWAVLEPAVGERGEGGGLLLGEVMLR
jgi:4-amino-4-deoxy-L-arabinose transferase-like glycosyltransferase